MDSFDSGRLTQESAPRVTNVRACTKLKDFVLNEIDLPEKVK